ncbi:MAG TPA: adenylate/guanylate cyclase domain-containing protein [Candidatus Thioglobus sp.]|nr:adenylate/guanylate cyclase domain-containing protein [Candidatus Thioglobus sp.]
MIIKTNLAISFYRTLLCLVLTFVFMSHSANWQKISAIQRMEHIFYDWRLTETMPNTIDERIVIIDIDEKSLLQEGRWPWSRDKLSYLVDLLFDYYNVNILAFDIVFSEKDTSSGLGLLEKLGKESLASDPLFNTVLNNIRAKLSYDELLAQSFKDRSVVLGYFVSHLKQKISIDTKLPAPALIVSPEVSKFFFQAKSYGANLTGLQNSSKSAGFFNNLNIDSDGVNRKLPLLLQYQDNTYEALSLAIYRKYLNNPPITLVSSDSYDFESRLEGIQIESFNIPVDNSGTILIPYRGLQGSFRYISITDILNGEVEEELLQGKIAIMGATAAGLLDLRSTPVQNSYPGVEIHANILSSLLDQDIKFRPSYLIAYEILELLFICFLAIYYFPKLSVIKASVVFVLLSLSIAYINLYLWVQIGIDSNFSTPFLLLCLLFVVQLVFGYLFESRRKKYLGNLFGQYIPPELVEQMSESNENFSLKGESKQMTVLFSDVRGFTTISENLNPQELCELINDILTPFTRIIHSNKGTIDKYMGDCVMAFWGAPLENDQHAADSVQAGLDMVDSLKGMQIDFEKRGLPYVDIGVGINTGVMSVGNMGSEFRTAYTVMGDAVNLGSRLEGLTKFYGVKFIVSESTKLAAPLYVYRALDKVQVKGKSAPITIYEVVAHVNTVSHDYLRYLSLLDEVFFHYYQQNWELAEQMLRLLQQQYPDNKLHDIYLERINEFKTKPPASNWNGVFVHTSK